MKNAEAKYMSEVARLGCMLCRVIGYGETPAELHHVREGQGMSQRAQNWLVIPLCPEHHRGSRGLHGNREELRMAKVDEIDLLAMTIEAMNDTR
jgi:hypothetical protein